VAVRFWPGAPRWRTSVAAVAAAAVLAVAGCSAGPAAEHRLPQDAAAYWDRTRLLAALPFGLRGRHLPLPGQSADSRTAGALAGLRVGALFEHGPTGNHFFTPDYRDGQEPFGVWTPAKLIVAPQWASSSDPDYDVGFVVLEPHGGKNIQQVLGASRLGTDLGDRYLVHVTGYPDSENVPITCVNWTSRFSDSQLKFECAGYTGGTSGSPWVTKFNAGSHTGTIVGVIGGYQEGGDTPSLSYSVRFGPAILALYRQAVTAGTAVAQPAVTAS
jgi:hypothetical protein